MTRLLLMLLALAGLAFAQPAGTLELQPASGPVGTQVTATAHGLEAGATIELAWMSADASWNVGEGTFEGITAVETRTVGAAATVGDDGSATMRFTVPEDYGYVHNVFVESGKERWARQGFTVVPQLAVSPTSGPVGTPITITMTGIGYRFWQSVWHLLYDGAHAGWMSAVTSHGTAVVTLPAAGAPGAHTLQALSGTHPVPYLNQQQSPNYQAVIPTVLSGVFEVTPGAAVPPPDPSTQTLPRHPGVAGGDPEGVNLRADFGSGPVGSPLTLSGSGFPASAPVELRWSTVTGNRISGAGWEERERVLTSVTADAEGGFEVNLATPDDLGGEHRVRAVAGDATATLVYTVTPSIAAVMPQVVEPGGDLTLTLKGVGWTATANIYTVLMDNGYIGYGCGFNSQGDVTIHLKAPGREGTHFLGVFPSIYQGTAVAPGGPSTPDANATYLQLPMLHVADHPGEELPAFLLAFEVRRP
ncbi:MAG: hypothetical protein P8Y13_15480 [Deinococcales bacterium]